MIDHIVATLAPRPEEHLIEIGPGQGALTVPVLRRTKQLEAVEFDRDLIPVLSERAKAAGDLTIYSADVLSFDFASVKKDERMLRVFGNLPYNISSPLIFHLLDYANIISDMLFMLQKEMAERLAATPGEHNGRLSIMVQYHCETNVLFNVPPSAFYPPPEVQSSIVQLVPYRECP
ncbi:MAG: ribosomal RNA small subunit methyltransferase A, partial [Gammaproteobacteria bacterium RIFCSPHIGHO2_12_FULL_40_19]